MSKLLRSLALLAMVALTGCVGTTPPRLYTLSMQRAGSAQPAFNIEVDRLRPADVLDRGPIVIRRGEHELDTYPLDTWASNLGELVAAKLAAEFGPSNPERPTLTLTGNIVAFEHVPAQDSGGEAHAALALEARKKGDTRYEEPLITKLYEARVPVSERSATGVVAALTRALESIAQSIATDVSTLTLPELPEKPGREEHLHTLDMTPSGSAISSLNIDVVSLRRHEALARNSILVRATPTTIEYYPQDRWAASVSTLVSEKLESEFGAPASGKDTAQLSGTILAFERVDGSDGPVAHVKLDMTLQRSVPQGRTRPMLWKVYEKSVPAASTSPHDIAKALSLAVTEIAATIAIDVERVPAPETPPTVELVRLYTLDMTPSGNAQCKHNVVFDRVAPHDSLTRADILIVRGQTEVDHFPNERWASSLAELVPEKLSAEFGPAQDDRRTVRVSGAVTGFEQSETEGLREGYVKLALEFRWSDIVTDPIRRTYAVRIPVDGEGAPALVKSLSRAVEDIAARIAADINALPEPELPPAQIDEPAVPTTP
ncbi:MAG: ABC-type transport auxiliary lipoprotein family protein [Candidatus Hydrogenedentes bacterium]|nr:ABC-type transport auxiliary lipoprotein family protein [Candidatus Hydrogenedentota bacterium]